jgi:hypothetical protein
MYVVAMTKGQKAVRMLKISELKDLKRRIFNLDAVER